MMEDTTNGTNTETEEAHTSRKTKAKKTENLDSKILADVNVQVSAILGRGRITVSELLALSGGQTMELDTPLDGAVDLVLNDKLIAKGEIVAVGDRFGVRITQMIVTKE